MAGDIKLYTFSQLGGTYPYHHHYCYYYYYYCIYNYITTNDSVLNVIVIEFYSRAESDVSFCYHFIQ